MMVRRKFVLALLCLTVLSPIVLYTDRLSAASSPNSNNEVDDGASTRSLKTNEVTELHALSQELTNAVKEPIAVLYFDNSNNSTPLSITPQNGLKASTDEELQSRTTEEYKSRVLSAALNDRTLPEEPVIKEVTDIATGNDGLEMPQSLDENENKEIGSHQSTFNSVSEGKREFSGLHFYKSIRIVRSSPMPLGKNKQMATRKISVIHHKVPNERKSSSKPISDAKVRQLKDQLIRAKVYLDTSPIRANPHLVRELRLRVREVQRVLGDATKDSDLRRNANDKLKAMELTLAKGNHIQDDSAAVVKKLRAMVHSSEEQLRVYRKQALFLTQIAAKTVPKGLHCLPLRLSVDYFSLNLSQQQFPHQSKLDDPRLHHYALFSDNVLATAVVVNSTVCNAKNAADHIFHIVTDRLNYAAMRMWFLANPPGQATIQVQNIEEFTWLNDSYSPVLKQLRSRSAIDYYFRTHATGSSDANMKYRNPKYLSILNHLRFYLPQVFPRLHKVVFLDDDIVVQKDLSDLWKINMKGKVNGAIETCGEIFHRFDKYLNFSNPLIASNFNARACGWAYGMNVFDLDEWRKQKITEVYHRWQSLNINRQLWKLGSLPPGLITFYNRTLPLDRRWHVLGLGYNPLVDQKEIERAAVIHYNGNLKPWLDIGILKYRGYWSKYVDYNHIFLRECNINP